jgi:hypothetical protein
MALDLASLLRVTVSKVKIANIIVKRCNAPEKKAAPTNSRKITPREEDLDPRTLTS